MQSFLAGSKAALNQATVSLSFWGGGLYIGPAFRRCGSGTRVWWPDRGRHPRARSLSDLVKFYQPRDKAAHDNGVEVVIPSSIQKTLLQEVAQQMHILPEDRESVERVTGFQQAAFEASLLPEWGLMDSFFSFLGLVYLHRLEHACEKLVARHGSLRTVFIENKGELFQVVMRHRLSDGPRLQSLAKLGLEVDIAGEEAVGEVPETGYGKPLIRFSIPQGETASQLVICLSHALYDGGAHILARSPASSTTVP